MSESTVGHVSGACPYNVLAVPTFHTKHETVMDDEESDDGRAEQFCLSVQFWPTVAFLGIQMGWAILYGYLTPILLSYDIGIEVVGCIWFLASFGSLLVCPLVGAASDFTKHPWGRRRIFMLGFLPVACGGMVLLAYSERLGAWLGDVPAEQENALAIAVVGIMVRRVASRRV